MTVRVEISPELLAWARQRSGVTFGDLSRRFPALGAWERHEQLPTMKQLEGYAQATHTPVGYFFLPTPPIERVPIPDYRTIGDVGVRSPSANLLDTIYQCEQRQDWYREYSRLNLLDPVGLIGTYTTATPPQEAADAIREALAFGVDNRASTWADALRILIDRIENLGVLVMVNGVVGSNTHRKLDPREFRGFALADKTAPLIFINGADTKAAQIFTLIHEFTHLWLGETALDDLDLSSLPGSKIERWCNVVTAEVLVPIAAVRNERQPGESVSDQIQRIAQRYKVSTLVGLRRLYDAGLLDWTEYRAEYQAELDRVMAIINERTPGGGNFCPAFWDWIDRAHTAGIVYSVDTVRAELLSQADELADWVRRRADGFFVAPNQATVPSLRDASTWVNSQGYTPVAVSGFLQVADYYLVAQALAEQHTVVTHEIFSDSTRRIKIPNVCLGLGVRYMTPSRCCEQSRPSSSSGLRRGSLPRRDEPDGRCHRFRAPVR
jgi:Zn-dependent peptidase ImmA (M78 family)